MRTREAWNEQHEHSSSNRRTHTQTFSSSSKTGFAEQMSNSTHRNDRTRENFWKRMRCGALMLRSLSQRESFVALSVSLPLFLFVFVHSKWRTFRLRSTVHRYFYASIALVTLKHSQSRGSRRNNERSNRCSCVCERTTQREREIASESQRI